MNPLFFRYSLLWRRPWFGSSVLGRWVLFGCGASLHGLLLWQFVNYRWAGWGEL